MMETWQEIPQFPLCEISDGGRLRLYWTRRMTQAGPVCSRVDVPVEAKRFINPRGYYYVRLRHEDDKFRNLQVHRLVLTVFVGPCPAGFEGCHRDGDKLNNRLDNLYWGSRRDNCFDTTRHGRNRKAKLSLEDQDELIRMHLAGARQVDMATRFGIGQCSISAFLLRRGFRRNRPRC